MNRIAGFFGGGGKKDDSDMAMPEKTDMALGADDYTSGHGSNFGAAPGAGGQVSRGPSKAAAASPEMLQRAVLQEQRHARVPIAGPARASARGCLCVYVCLRTRVLACVLACVLVCVCACVHARV